MTASRLSILLVLAAGTALVAGSASAAPGAGAPADAILLDAAPTVVWQLEEPRAERAQPIVLAAKKAKRYGIEGRIKGFDESKNVLTVQVVKTKAGGGVGGSVAGAKAPRDIKRGADVPFKVVPEGSVLKRTVVKGRQGGGLDNTGTIEGFKKALSMVPDNRNVVFSFEKIDKPKAGEPEYVLKIIQLLISQEEAEEAMRQAEAEAEKNANRE